MSNKRHDEFESRNEKWRLASNKCTDLRYALEDVLASFTDDEKKSIRYKQFISTVSSQFDHLLGDIYKNKIEEHESQVLSSKTVADNAAAEAAKAKAELDAALAKSQAEVAKVEAESKNKIFSYRSAIIAAVGAAVIQLIQSLPQILSALSSLIGGQP